MQEYFQLLNKYYDKIYVVSLKDATERRERFSNYFKGLDYSFFYGADKNNFTKSQIIADGTFSEDLAKMHHRFNKTMKLGEIACSWSHKMVYEDVLANNYKQVMIFEDDAVPDKEIVNHIPEILNDIPKDCELLMWGWKKNGTRNFGTRLKQLLYHILHKAGTLKWDHTIIRNMFAKKFSPNLKKAGFHDYTYAYAINQNAATKLLSMQTPIQYIADNLLAHAATKAIVKGYITWPSVFLHDNLQDGTHRDSYIR